MTTATIEDVTDRGSELFFNLIIFSLQQSAPVSNTSSTGFDVSIIFAGETYFGRITGENLQYVSDGNGNLFWSGGVIDTVEYSLNGTLLATLVDVNLDFAVLQPIAIQDITREDVTALEDFFLSRDWTIQLPDGGNTFGFGTIGENVVFNLEGNDTIIGGTGNDFIFSGNGNDTIIGGDGNDGLQGGAGDDIIDGGAGDDSIIGGGGADILVGGEGNDWVNYWPIVSDRVEIRLTTQTVNTGDTISGFENATTGGGDDALIGSDVDNVLQANGGDDYLDGLGGNDALFGGEGNDRLFGREGDDELVGGAGDDTLDGGAGNDIIEGGAGSDTLMGGAGSDRFEAEGQNFQSSLDEFNGDTITDFSVEDSILVSGFNISVLGNSVVVDNGAGGTAIELSGATINLDGLAVDDLLIGVTDRLNGHELFLYQDGGLDFVLDEDRFEFIAELEEARLTIEAGVTIDNLIDLEGGTDFAVVNNGTIASRGVGIESLQSTFINTGTIEGIFGLNFTTLEVDAPSSATVTNTENGVISVSGTAFNIQSGSVFGPPTAGMDVVTINNDGLIETSFNGIQGGTQDSLTINNTGTFRTIDRAEGFGVGASLGIGGSGQNQTTLNNSGVIEVLSAVGGFVGEEAVTIFGGAFNGGNYDLVNSGRISSTGTAIRLGGTSDTNTTYTVNITNTATGRIEGDTNGNGDGVAINGSSYFVVSNLPALPEPTVEVLNQYTIDNAGRIVGDVILYDDDYFALNGSLGFFPENDEEFGFRSVQVLSIPGAPDLIRQDEDGDGNFVFDADGNPVFSPGSVFVEGIGTLNYSVTAGMVTVTDTNGEQVILLPDADDLERGVFDDTFTNSGTVDGNINLGVGNDTFVATDTSQVSGVIDGDLGVDHLDLSALTRSVNVSLINQIDNDFHTVAGFENVTTGSGDDLIVGSDTDNVLISGAGNDTISGGSGNDTLDGGDGNDTVVFDETDRVVVRLNNQTVNTGDTIANFENATTGAGNDALIGSAVANILTAGAGDDYLDGQAGDDVLNGGTGNDRLFGRDGNDTLLGGSGNDTLDGGDGNDTVVFDEAGRVVVRLNSQTVSTGDTIAGFENATTGAGNDALIGSAVANILTAGAGDDYLDGLDGDDVLNGESGNDRLFGRDGNDTLAGGAGNDTLDGGDGNDTVVFDEAGRVVVRLNSQTVSTGDTIAGFENATTGAGNDALIGSAVANVLTAGAGDDYIDAQGGNDVLYGGEGDDRLFGQDGNDSLSGGSGNDQLFGGNGDDILSGGAGIDELNGGNGFDIIDFSNESSRVVVRINEQTVSTGDLISGIEGAVTGSGNDALIGSNDTDVLSAGAGDDYLDGLAGDDILIGGAGNDRLFGRDGDDTLYAGSGNDTLDGGAGNDMVVFEDAERIVVRLNTQTISTGDTIASIENAVTGAGNDALIGSSVANMLIGGAGDDYLDGQGGNDTLIGETGNDRYVGGAGRDSFVYETLTGGSDQILDFTQGDDRIVFDDVNAAFDSFAEVMAAGTQDGADTVFDFGGGNVLRLAGTDLSALNIDDMLFAATGSMASAKPDGEGLSGLSAFYDGVDTVNHSQLANETLLSDFDDFAVDDQGHLALPYEAAPLMTYRGQDGMLHIFDPETMQQPDDFTGFEIA